MNDTIWFRGIQLDPDIRSATRDDGLTIKFTRSERSVVSALTSRPGEVFTRDRLLDAISGEGSESSDRNIDFVINRLRRKLGDPARSPTYIATHYGEGYSWIAPMVSDRPVAEGAFVVIGPLRGINRIGDFAAMAESFARELHRAVDKVTAKDRPVVLDPDCPPADAFQNDAPEYAMDLNFLQIGNLLDCVVTLKNFRAGTIIRVTRERLGRDEDAEGLPLTETVKSLAEQLANALWDSLVVQQSTSELPSSEPLAVRFKTAALMLSNEDKAGASHAASSLPEYDRRMVEDNRMGWQETQKRLRETLKSDPNDPVAKLMLAASVRTKYVAADLSVYGGPDNRRQDEDEMEQLVITSLPHLQSNPLFCLTAAQVLFFIDRGYRQLAVQLAEDAFSSTTALTEALVIVGWLRMFLGEIEQATDLFGQVWDLGEMKSLDAKVYLLILRCIAFLAGGDRNALDRELEILHETNPESKAFMGLYFAPDDSDSIAPETKFLVSQLDEATAQAMLVYSYYSFARLFSYDDHRENIMRPPLMLLTQRFGYDFVPDEVRRSVPALFPPPA